ncbi:unannotated protein [freshwater metagenome]|uniref:Unannotated protein n=1 Tax=freshwater metagenome TaxID=449393 RepID=A0A6J7K7S0_9ZZZZ
MSATDLDAITSKFGDPEGVLISLCGKSSQEVELDPSPTVRERSLHSAVEVLFADQFVDHLTHPPGAGLGCERETSPATMLELRGDPYPERINTETRQRNRDRRAIAGSINDVGHESFDARVVGGRERGQRNLVVSGASETFSDHRSNLCSGTLTNWSCDHPGLTESAATGAAAEHFDVQAVVHDLGQGDELLFRIGEIREVGDRALLDEFGNVRKLWLKAEEVSAGIHRSIHRGHVHALNPGEGAQHPDTIAKKSTRGLPVTHHFGDFGDYFLAIAEDHDVEKVGKGLRVVRAVTAGGDQGMLRAAIG